MADLDISLDQILAYLGAEHIHRQILLTQNEELQAQVMGLKTAMALMAEKIHAQENSTNGAVCEAGRTLPAPSGVESTESR